MDISLNASDISMKQENDVYLPYNHTNVSYASFSELVLTEFCIIVCTVFILLSNGIIIGLVLFKPTLHKPHLFAVAGCAFTDFLVAATSCPLLLLGLLTDVNEALYLCDMAVIPLSALSVCLYQPAYLAFERYRYFCHPLNYTQVITPLRVAFAQLGMWTLAITYMSIAFVIDGRTKYVSTMVCQQNSTTLFTVLHVVIILMMPLSITIYCTRAIYKTIHRIHNDDRSLLRKFRTVQSSETATTSTCPSASTCPTTISSSVGRETSIGVETGRKRCVADDSVNVNNADARLEVTDEVTSVDDEQGHTGRTRTQSLVVINLTPEDSKTEQKTISKIDSCKSEDISKSQTKYLAIRPSCIIGKDGQGKDCDLAVEHVNTAVPNAAPAILQNARKTVKMILMVAGTFWATYIPAYVLRVMALSIATWADIESRRSLSGFILMRLSCLMMWHISSALNPLVYLYTCRELRDVFLKTFGYKKRNNVLVN